MIPFRWRSVEHFGHGRFDAFVIGPSDSGIAIRMDSSFTSLRQSVNDNVPAIHVVNNTEGGPALPASPRENAQ